MYFWNELSVQALLALTSFTVPTLPTPPTHQFRMHSAPARALVPTPVLQWTCLPLILSPGTFIFHTSYGHGLMLCPGQCSLALQPTPECLGHLSQLWLLLLDELGDLPWECGSVPAVSPRSPSSCNLWQIFCWKIESWSVWWTCPSDPRSGIEFLDFQHTQVALRFLLTSSLLCTGGWLLNLLHL